MAEASLQVETPSERGHTSSEQTLAQLDHFRQMPWLPPDLADGTLDNLQVIERYWHRYANHIHVDYKTTLLSAEPATYMAFIDLTKQQWQNSIDTPAPL